MTQRTTQGVRKIIFWFVAKADSTTVPEDGTQQENEDFDVMWTDLNQVANSLSFGDDIRIIEAAIGAIQRS